MLASVHANLAWRKRFHPVSNFTGYRNFTATRWILAIRDRRGAKGWVPVSYGTPGEASSVAVTLLAGIYSTSIGSAHGRALCLRQSEGTAVLVERRGASFASVEHPQHVGYEEDQQYGAQPYARTPTITPAAMAVVPSATP